MCFCAVDVLFVLVTVSHHRLCNPKMQTIHQKHAIYFPNLEGEDEAASLFYSFNPTTCHLDGTWAMGKFNIEPHHDQGLITVG